MQWTAFSPLGGFFLLFLIPSSPASALILNGPVDGSGNPVSNLVAGDSATVSWTLEEGDPSVLSFRLLDQQSGDMFRLARRIDSSLGQLSFPVPQVSGCVSKWHM